MSIFDSNRTGHMFAAISASIGVTIAAHHYGIPVLQKAGPVIFLFELVASPDVDVEQRKPKRGKPLRNLWVRFWDPFAEIIPHRSKWSHSLLIGTPFRMFYLTFPFLLIGIVAAFFRGYDVMAWAKLTLTEPWPFLKWLWSLRWLAIAAWLNDCVHLFKDGYFWSQPLKVILFGRNSGSSSRNGWKQGRKRNGTRRRSR